MNEDYLWDRSGETDHEVQELEEVLGTLRYQPRPLEIPEQSFRRHHRFVIRGLAIAAAIAMFAFGLGVWLAMQQPETPDSAVTAPSVATPTVEDTRAAAGQVDAQKLKDLQAAIVPTPAAKSPTIKRRRSNLSTTRVAEAKVAKDQLMLALRLASSKLSLVQKKTQPETVHNQHKIG